MDVPVETWEYPGAEGEKDFLEYQVRFLENRLAQMKKRLSGLDQKAED